MKLYSKKNLWNGILFTSFVLLYLWKNQGQLDTLFPIDWLILAYFSLCACINFYTAFSKKHGTKAFIEEHDEREAFLQLKIYRTSFWICLIGLLFVGWFFRTHAADEAAGYVGEGMLLSALLFLLLHTLICGLSSLFRTCEQAEDTQ